MNQFHQSTTHWANFINGEWVDSKQFIEVENPATGQLVGTIACATQKQVDMAVNAARECHRSRRVAGMDPYQRMQLLHTIAAEIRALAKRGGELLCLENGKPLSQAEWEFEEAARYFEYYAGMADKIEGQSIPLGDGLVDFTEYEPFGVSAQVIPWNFPVSLVARSLAPALAAGNSVVIKSPELTPLAVALLAEAMVNAKVPAGAVNILCGYGHDTGVALVSHSDIDQIVFTGSVATGQSIMKAATTHVVPSVMELGGKSAGIVFADADLDQVISSAEVGNLYNSGQVCSAMARLIVHQSVYEEVKQRLTQCFAAKTVGAGIDEADVTPILTQLQLDKIAAMCSQAKQQGAHCLLGGAPLDRPGYFMPPTIIEADVDADIAQQEVFGPVLVIMSFNTEDEAYAMANSTDFGLVAGVFTKDLSRALRASRALIAGQVFVNEWFAGGISTPFGGVGKSGFGREKGQEALYNYVRTKNIAIRLTP
ncbi:MAG: aldehyde dehydrogenase family protein [Gammaproteobacteria bacterium]|nr:aldehyde dehydrogenase family protein [Gammaproteobacteria bacterium]